jgi:uncharacterized protein YndB with AHSA1/START domain
MTTGQVAARFKVSRIAVMHHLKVLAAVGLVVSRKRGRQRFHYLNAVPLQRVHDRWVAALPAGWAARLSALDHHLAARPQMAGPTSQLAVDIAQELDLPGDRSRVFTALTAEVDAWWGKPFLSEDAVGLTLDARVGGHFEERWLRGGRLLAVVTGLDRDRRLELTGPLHLGVVYGVVEFELEEARPGTRLRFSHRAIGQVDAEVIEAFRGGWVELLDGRLRAYLERGERRGIAGGHGQGSE